MTNSSLRLNLSPRNSARKIDRGGDSVGGCLEKKCNIGSEAESLDEDRSIICDSAIGNGESDGEESVEPGLLLII